MIIKISNLSFVLNLQSRFTFIMVFTPQHDAFILKAHYRSGTVNEDGTWTYSLRSCLNQFNEAFPDVNIPYKTFVMHKSRIIDRFEGKNCICKGKSTGRPSILTEEVVADIQQRLEQSPTKSLRKLSAQSGLYLISVFYSINNV